MHSSNWESGCWFYDEISWSLRAAKHDDFSELGCFGSETNVVYGCITTAPPATTAIWFSKTPLLHLMLCKKSSICGSRSAVSIKPWVRLKRWILRSGLEGNSSPPLFTASVCLETMETLEPSTIVTHATCNKILSNGQKSISCIHRSFSVRFHPTVSETSRSNGFPFKSHGGCSSHVRGGLKRAAKEDEELPQNYWGTVGIYRLMIHPKKLGKNQAHLTSLCDSNDNELVSWDLFHPSY